MARPEPDRLLRPSVLDRLVDLNPHEPAGPDAGPPAGLAAVKAGVRRDLEWLLNSKRTAGPVPPGAAELGRSLLTYGLPDFTHVGLDRQDDLRALRQAVEDAIERFEPLLKRVSVVVVEGPKHERSVRFRIDALLMVEPTPEAVSFDSELRMPDRSFVLQGD